MYQILRIIPRLRPLALLSLLLLPGRAFAWQLTTRPGTTLRSVVGLSDGGALVAGSWQAPPAAPVAYAARYTASGSLRWETHDTFPGAFATATAGADGSLFAGGTTTSDSGIGTAIAASIDPATGALLWQAPLTGSGSGDGAVATLTVTAGGLAVGGALPSGGGSAGFVSLLNAASGGEIWRWTLDGTMVRALAATRTGDVCATGTGFLAVKLAAASGAEQFRMLDPGPNGSSLGRPQMRTLALNKSGDLTVGGSLRDVVDDTRAFYVARVSGTRGTITWEYAGAPRPAFETPAELALDSSGDVYSGGRLATVPAVTRVNGKSGALRWARQPWTVDAEADRSTGVVDVVVDGSSVYACGSDQGGRLLAGAYSHTGARRWSLDLGEGSGIATALASGGRLYLLGTLSSPDGQSVRTVLVGLRATSGKSL
jgi:hypothetical protein